MLSGKQARGQGSEGGDGGQRGAEWADKHCFQEKTRKNETDTVTSGSEKKPREPETDRTYPRHIYG